MTNRGGNNGFFKGGLANLKPKFYCQKWEKNRFDEKKVTDISLDHLLSLVEGSRMKGLIIFLFLWRTSEEISCLMYHPHQRQLVGSCKTCFMWSQGRNEPQDCIFLQHQHPRINAVGTWQQETLPGEPWLCWSKICFQEAWEQISLMLFHERNKLNSSKLGKIYNLLKYIWVASKLCAERPADLEG